VNPSDRLRQIAAAQYASNPALCADLLAIAVAVARMERTLDEIVTDAMEDVQAAYNAAQASRPCAVIIRPEFWERGR
jgi:hypothetical protein